MKRLFSIFILSVLCTLLSGQNTNPEAGVDTTWSFHQQIGYILPKSDSLNTPIFINGVYIGKTPIKEPIPIENGIHEVSYLPPNFEIPSIKVRLPEAVKRVYIPANDTITVSLIYDIHRGEFKRIRQEQIVTYSVGFTITCLILYLMWMI